jgi:hypothetical protein
VAVAPSTLLRRVRLPDRFSLKFEVRGLLAGIVEFKAYNVLSLVDGAGGSQLTVNIWPDGNMDVHYGTDVISSSGGMLPTVDPLSPDWTTLTLTVSRPYATYPYVDVTLRSGGDPVQQLGLNPVPVSNVDLYLYAGRPNTDASSGEIRNIQISGKIRVIRECSCSRVMTVHFARVLYAASAMTVVDCTVSCAPLGGNTVPIAYDNFLGLVLQLPRDFALTFEVRGVTTGVGGTPNILTLFPAEGFSKVLGVYNAAGNAVQFKVKDQMLTGPFLPAAIATEWAGVEIVVNPVELTISIVGGDSIISYATAAVGNVSTPRDVLLYVSSGVDDSAGGYIRNIRVTSKSSASCFWTVFFDGTDFCGSYRFGDTAHRGANSGALYRREPDPSSKGPHSSSHGSDNRATDRGLHTLLLHADALCCADSVQPRH